MWKTLPCSWELEVHRYRELGSRGDILGLVSWVIRSGSRVGCRCVLEDGGGGGEPC